MRVNGIECIKCKGRNWCGKDCIILESYKRKSSFASKIKNKSFEGSFPPSIFVSWHNYPKIDVAPLCASFFSEEVKLLDEPENWFSFPQEKIIEMRDSLMQLRKKFNAFSALNPSRELSLIQETVLSSVPVSASIELNKILSYRLSFDSFSFPLGPKAELKKFLLNENPKIPRKVDYITSDTDLPSSEALIELYFSNLSVNSLQKILSVGLLGLKRKRRLLPTRWSITAVDELISRKLTEKIKLFKELDCIQLFESSYLNNRFFVLLIPGCWAFEQLEAWKPNSVWIKEGSTKVISDFESFRGRKDYASNVAGAYYSARLAVTEFLFKKKRQAKALVFREIGDYGIPLGSWLIRESVRDALKKNPLCFSDIELALKFISSRLAVSLKRYLSHCNLLNELNQKKLSFFV
jgi:hypothetical protein